MAENTMRACPKDCRQCSMAQQLYCSTSLSFTQFEVMGKMLERLERIENDMRMMQGSGNDLVNPQTDKLESQQPQKASGGDNRLLN